MMLTGKQKFRKWVALTAVLGFVAFMLYLFFFTNFAEVGTVIEVHEGGGMREGKLIGVDERGILIDSKREIGGGTFPVQYYIPLDNISTVAIPQNREK